MRAGGSRINKELGVTGDNSEPMAVKMTGRGLNRALLADNAVFRHPVR
jgi:hypothetical protein